MGKRGTVVWTIETTVKKKWFFFSKEKYDDQKQIIVGVCELRAYEVSRGASHVLCVCVCVLGHRTALVCITYHMNVVFWILAVVVYISNEDEHVAGAQHV